MACLIPVESKAAGASGYLQKSIWLHKIRADNGKVRLYLRPNVQHILCSVQVNTEPNFSFCSFDAFQICRSFPSVCRRHRSLFVISSGETGVHFQLEKPSFLLISRTFDDSPACLLALSHITQYPQHVCCWLCSWFWCRWSWLHRVSLLKASNWRHAGVSVSDHHTDRLLVLWGTSSAAPGTTGTEGGDDSDPEIISGEPAGKPQQSVCTEPLEQVEVGSQRTDGETGRRSERQVERQVLLVTEEECLFLHPRPSGNLLKSRQEG